MNTNVTKNSIECLTIGVANLQNTNKSNANANNLLVNVLRNRGLKDSEIKNLFGTSKYGPEHEFMIPGKIHKWVHWLATGICFFCEDIGIKDSMDCEEIQKIPTNKMLVIVTKPEAELPSLILPCICREIDSSNLTYKVDFIDGYLKVIETMTFNAYDIQQVLLCRDIQLDKNIDFTVMPSPKVKTVGRQLQGNLQHNRNIVKINHNRTYRIA